MDPASPLVLRLDGEFDESPVYRALRLFGKVDHGERVVDGLGRLRCHWCGNPLTPTAHRVEHLCLKVSGLCTF